MKKQGDRQGADKWVKMFGSGKGCRGERVRKMGNGWIDEEKKCCDRSCLVKVMRLSRGELVSRRISVKRWDDAAFLLKKMLF